MRFPATLPLMLALIVALPAVASVDADDRSLDRQLLDAMKGKPDIRARTFVLAGLAWSEETEEDLARHARNRLIESGFQGLEATADAFNWAERSRFADIMLAVTQVEASVSGGKSPHSLEALDKSIWFGPPDAKRVAMRHMARRPVRTLLLSVIDAAYEYPQLTATVIETLALMQDERARFFLADQAQTASPQNRKRAAQALSVIGGRSLEYLRAWTLSPDPDMRQLALDALLPVSTVSDLTTLYEYLQLFPEDDPALLDKLRSRAEFLEQAILAHEEQEARTPGLDD